MAENRPLTNTIRAPSPGGKCTDGGAFAGDPAAGRKGVFAIRAMFVYFQATFLPAGSPSAEKRANAFCRMLASQAGSAANRFSSKLARLAP